MMHCNQHHYRRAIKSRSFAFVTLFCPTTFLLQRDNGFHIRISFTQLNVTVPLGVERPIYCFCAVERPNFQRGGS